MKLHEDKQLFADLILAASQPIEAGGLGIKREFIEKDYWITRALKQLAETDPDHNAIFKGGTSLSKVYGIGARFSEDIDIAIREAATLSDNQLKKILTRTIHNMSQGLNEIEIPGKTKKSSKYRKQYFRYEQVLPTESASVVNTGQILIEINSFANPYPFEVRRIASFAYDFLSKRNPAMIAQYGLEPFEIAVLDIKRTFTEKMVSLFRYSLADEYIQNLSAKIRHFYDLHFLLKEQSIKDYISSTEFMTDFQNLFNEDQERFDYPAGWQTKRLDDSPLIMDTASVWSRVADVYNRELRFLAYRQVPTAEAILASLQERISLLK